MQFKVEKWRVEILKVMEIIKSLKPWDYEIKKLKKDRTTQQNRYLWGWVYWTIAEYMWEDTEYIHWVMGMKFLLDRTKKAPYIKSTAKLNTAEFTEYVENIKNYVAPFGVIIPSAEEYLIYNK